jgi:hypothetical protein
MKESEDILKRAVGALKSEKIPDGPPKELTDATMAKLAEVSGGPDGVTCSGRVRIAERLLAAKGLARLAAAAVLLIAAGYAGRLSVPPPDGEQLQATLEPAIREALLGEMTEYLRLALAGSHAQLRDELSEQYRRDLGQVATQTLVASGAVTNRLLEDLIESISAAQIQDRRWMAAALEQIESNRLQDKDQLSDALVTFAVRTEDELIRTRQNMAELFSYTQPQPDEQIDGQNP